MANKFDLQRSSDPLTLGTKAVTYVPADADLPPEVKAIVFDADGTVTFKNTSGGAAVSGFPVKQGYPMPFIPARLTAMTGPTTCFLVS